MPLTIDEEIELLELEIELAERDAASAAPREELTGVETARGGLQSALGGLTAGFSDEIVGAGRAALDYVLPETEADRIAAQFGGEEQSFADRYAMFRDEERDIKKQFAEENPKTALGLEVAGAVVSPLNKVAPGLGTTGGTGARLAGSAARAAGEGALYGLGEGEGTIEEQLQNAAKGAVTGAGIAAGLTGAGGALGRTLSKRRVAEDLQDAAGNFRPLHMADSEGGLGQFYRSVVGGSFGGRGALGRQESQYLNRAPKLARFADETGDVVEETVGTVGGVRSVKNRIDDAARIAKDSAKEASRRIDAEDALETSRYALQRSVPEGYADEITEIGTAGVQQADTAIKRAYSDAWGDAVAGPVAIGNVRSVAGDVAKELKKTERASINRIIQDLQNGKSLELVDRELRELLSGKSSSAMSKAVNGMRSSLRSTLPVERQAILEAADNVYPNYLATLRASTTPGAQARGGVFNAKELSSAAKQAKGWRQAGQGRSDLFEYTRPVLQKTKAAKESLKNKEKRIGQVARASKNRLEKATQGILPETATAWSQLAPTVALGVLGGPMAIPTGAAIARGLTNQGIQKTLAGQTAWQKWLEEALRKGTLAPASRIPARLAAQQATQENE